MASIAPSDDMWGDFGADIAAQPAVGVDPSTSWFTIACVYLFLPLHLLVTFVAFKIPAVGRALGSAAIVFYQSGVAGGPDKRNPFIVPAVIWSTLSQLATFIVKFKGQRFQLYEFVHKTYGGQGWGWFTEGPGRFGYEPNREIMASDQSRSRFFGAMTANCPQGMPSQLLLFLDGEHHKAVRSQTVQLLLSSYKPRAPMLPKVLAPLLPAESTLAAFVDEAGNVNADLCARLVARCLYFLIFGEAGLLEGEQLQTVADWRLTAKVLVMPRFMDRLLFGKLSKKGLTSRRATAQLLKDKGLDEVFFKMNAALPPQYKSRTVVSLADDVMTGIGFAGVNGTTHLLTSCLAHLVGGVNDIPKEALALPPTASLVPLYKKDPEAFIIESARVSPPVGGACCRVKEATDVKMTWGCGSTSLKVKAGTPLLYNITAANRDPTVFAEPNTFNPARKNLKKMLSWNGALEEPAKYPRFCPGQQISLTIVKAILGSIEELKPDASITGSVKNLLSREPSTKM